MSNLLFTTSGASGRFKRLKRDLYKLILEGVDERLTWFTDKPNRQAGSITADNLISQWDSGFAESQPNSALIFRDKHGKRDTVVFEQSKPKYIATKNKLVFKAQIHDQQKIDAIGGALSNVAMEADDKFLNNFSDFTLFIDNWLSKDTSVNFINTSKSALEFFKIEFNSVDGRRLMSEGLSTGILAFGAKGGCFNCAAGALGSAVDTLTGILFPDTQATISYNNSFVLKPGEERRITDVDTQSGFSNDVADVAYHIQSRGSDRGKAEGIGAVYFDNPTIGKPKAKIITYAETGTSTTGFKSVPPWIPSRGDVKSWPAFNELTFTGRYFGDIEHDGSTVKGWDLVVS